MMIREEGHPRLIHCQMPLSVWVLKYKSLLCSKKTCSITVFPFLKILIFSNLPPARKVEIVYFTVRDPLMRKENTLTS